MVEWVAILNLIKKIWPYVAGVALLAGAYFYIDHKGYERAEQKAKIEISEIKVASAQSEAEAWKQKAKAEERYAEQANKADEAVASLRSELNANLLRFAQAQRPAGQAGSTSSGNTAKGGNGPGSNPQLSYVLPDDTEVKITYKDAKICADNTARLVEVHNWGQSILADQSKKSETQPIPTKTD